MATIIATKTVTIVKNAKALVHNRAFQASVAVAGTLYLIAKLSGRSNTDTPVYSSMAFSNPALRSISIRNPYGKVYLTGSQQRGNLAQREVINGPLTYDGYNEDDIRNGIISFNVVPKPQVAMPQSGRLTRFCDWLWRKHASAQSAHLFFEVPRNIPVNIQAQNSPIQLVGGGLTFANELRAHGLDGNSPHAVIINGFIDGQDPHQSVDVTVGPGDTIAVQNCTPQTVNGIYRNHFHQ